MIIMKNGDNIWIYISCIIVVLLTFESISFESNAQESSDPLKDIDGNVYKTVKIGTQIWLAENLKTARYSDSTEIPYVINDTAWAELKTAAYCWYNNAIANKSEYGALYNWYAVNTNKLCPTGWHVPGKDDWTTLAVYVNENGGKLKDVGPIRWNNPKYNPNIGATNESGFTALLGGFRSGEGAFHSIRQAGSWWSASDCIECDTYPELKLNDAWHISLGAKSSGYGNQHDNKSYGYSIRCMKDN
jgi:uncharacterized protein (TIGR02145 family)